MADAVLTRRALNRSLLARQGLLERSKLPALEMVERLVGLQAQVPENPYVALWSRLEAFRAEELSDAIAGRDAARAQLMRSTIHLVSARDCMTMDPLTRPVVVRTAKAPWLTKLGGADPEEVAAAARTLLTERPRTRADLDALLAPRWPDAEPMALAYAATSFVPVVQVPPRGLWGEGGQATWAPADGWLGRELDADPSIDALILRYLAAFGPATVADATTWSRLTGLRAVFERLRPQLRTFRDEHGRELFDVEGAPHPDPDTPAPPRFLPEYDNVGLSHQDRSRLLAGYGPDGPFPTGKWVGTLLADGFARASWRATSANGAATLTVNGFTRRRSDPSGTRAGVQAEAAGLLAFIAPDAPDRRVTFA